mmetsp:Transcript_111841/g.194154  ORF Transcript_111841/g.194154 Transcript_111841/m.194154 type:complete len:365 (-) Transcript_111841:2129-3223(-)
MGRAKEGLALLDAFLEHLCPVVTARLLGRLVGWKQPNSESWNLGLIFSTRAGGPFNLHCPPGRWSQNGRTWGSWLGNADSGIQVVLWEEEALIVVVGHYEQLGDVLVLLLVLAEDVPESSERLHCGGKPVLLVQVCVRIVVQHQHIVGRAEHEPVEIVATNHQHPFVLFGETLRTEGLARPVVEPFGGALQESRTKRSQLCGGNPRGLWVDAQREGPVEFVVDDDDLVLTSTWEIPAETRDHVLGVYHMVHLVLEEADLVVEVPLGVQLPERVVGQQLSVADGGLRGFLLAAELDQHRHPVAQIRELRLCEQIELAKGEGLRLPLCVLDGRHVVQVDAWRAGRLRRGRHGLRDDGPSAGSCWLR